MINYIKVINRFWDDAPDQDGYKSDHAVLFHAIVDSINRNGWRETAIEYDRIIYKVRLGKTNYLLARKWLVDNQYLTVKEGVGRYAKAKFNLGKAVLGRTGSETGSQLQTPALPVPVPVLPETGSETGSSTLPVDSGTGSRTGSETGSGTGTHTHLIVNNKTLKPETLKQQQQHDSPNGESDGGGDEVEGLTGDGVDPFQKKGEELAHPPTPLPTIDEVRAALLGSVPHRRYAIEQIKVASDLPVYTSLVDVYVTQQEAQADEQHPAFKSVRDARRHFMNWLGRRTEFISTPTNSNGSSNKRTSGSLRPTSLGTPNYSGEGSTCDVEL